LLAELNREQRIPIALDVAGDWRSWRRIWWACPRKKAMGGRCVKARNWHAAKADAGLLDAVDGCEARRCLKTEGLIENRAAARRVSYFADVAGLPAFCANGLGRERAAPDGGRPAISELVAARKGVLIHRACRVAGKVWRRARWRGSGATSWRGLDAGALYDKYIGESERRLHKGVGTGAKACAHGCCGLMRLRRHLLRRARAADADAGLSQRLLATRC